jgi:hypothetical protein
MTLHHNNNHSDALNKDRPSADELRSSDPQFRRLASGRAQYSEAINAVMDEMSGTATSRRADVLNSLRQ